MAGGEGAMRGALEGAAVCVAPSMNAQNVANTIWGLATPQPVPEIPESRFIVFAFKLRFVPARASLNRGFRGLAPTHRHVISCVC
jgi:hypothetical protein